MTHRVHNFCAGPCTLPLPVLEEVAHELVEFDNSGMSLIEMSHRSPVYDEVHHNTMSLLRELMHVPDDVSVLLLQGGATLQFAMVPMNTLTPGTTAGYIDSGTWGSKALADASRWGDAYPAWSGAEEGYSRMPETSDLDIRPGSRYLHLTSNETIGGIRMPDFPEVDIPLIGDMSSDFLTRPVPWDRFDLIYGGAQKNLGPAGLAVVFVRDRLIESAPDDLPSYLAYATHAKADSLANTPPMFPIWVMGKVLAWMKEQGGVEAMSTQTAAKARAVYDIIDSGEFYRSPVDPRYRSHTNVVFRLPSPELETEFLAEADKAGMANLKGHRSVGGIRASLYVGLPMDWATDLAEFMSDFRATRG